MSRLAKTYLLAGLLLGLGLGGSAQGLVCGTAKAVGTRQQIPPTGQVHALALFGRFADEQGQAAPDFARQLFDPGRPGSATHFYTEMSHGQFLLSGEAIPKWYAARRPAAEYLASPGQVGIYGRIGEFSREVLEAADAELDLGQHDNDGPDGVPNSGDDDGYVDFLFINTLSAPYGFIVGAATGIALLGLDRDYISDDEAARGGYIRVRGDENPKGIGGVVAQGHTFAVAAAAMAHEFGHALGLPDLFDKDFQRQGAEETEPEKDSAGVGYWCLMAHGTRGWEDRGGPNPFCAWALEQLGWIGVDNQDLVVVEKTLKDAVFEDVRAGGKVYKLPTRNPLDYFLVEYRRPGNSFYEHDLPGTGLLIWHIDQRGSNDTEENKLVDLVCADGLFADAGYPLGRIPDPETGRDNLDFWAHDEDYRRAHQGNLGDAADMFDGVRFSEFSTLTNPAAPPGISVENIRRQGERMEADLSADDRRWAGWVKGKVAWKDTVEVMGDVIISQESSLFIEPGTVVLFGPDQFHRRNPQRIELVVEGTLRAGSLTGKPVRFTSASAQPRPGDWYGIIAENLGIVYLENVEIEYAQEGVVGVGLRSPQALVQVAVRQAAQYGLHFEPNNGFLRLTQVEVEGCGLAGVRITGGGSVVVEESRFADNGRSGLEQVGGFLDCRASEFSGNGSNEGANLVLERVASGWVRDNRFAGGRVGIYGDTMGAMVIERNRLEGHQVGLLMADSAPYILRNEFVRDDLVLQIAGDRVPKKVELNTVQAATHLVENTAELSVAAAYNWWGQAEEDWIAARMHGQVEWHPFLQGDPKGLPLAVSLEQNYPNPFNSSTAIRFAIGATEVVLANRRDMVLEVRTLAGQLVRRLVQQPAMPGEYEVVWDGRDPQGERAASGVYYYQLEVGPIRRTRQLMLLK